MNKLKHYWQIVAGRVDAMPLRQRAMLFAALSLVVVAATHTVLFEPALNRQKTLIDRYNRDQSQLAAVRGQISAFLKDQEAQANSPEQVALRELEKRVADGEAALAQRKQDFLAPTRLPPLLNDLLGPAQTVRIESLRVMPGAPVAAAPEFHRHGVEVTLKGGYFDLAQYLASLEKMPARFLWGRMEMQVEQYPEVRLTLQVHTLSPQRALGL